MQENNNKRIQDHTIAELRKQCQYIPPEVMQTVAGKVSRWFSIYLTWFLLRIKTTPNQITVFATFLYLIGAGLFALNDFVLNFVAFGFLMVSTLFDASDGEVARFYQYKGGYGNSYVEPLSHDIMYGLMFMPIAFGAYQMTGSVVFLLAGAATTIFKLLFRMTQVRFFYGVQQLMPERGHHDPTKKLIEQSGFTKLVYTVYRNTATSSGLHVFLLLAIIFYRLDVFIVAYACIFFLLWCGLFMRQMLRFSNISKQVMQRQ